MQPSALEKALGSPYTASLGASWTSWGILIQTWLNVIHTLPFAAQHSSARDFLASQHCLEVSLRSGKDLVAIPHCLRMGNYWRTSSILQASAFAGHPAQLGTERRWTQTSWSSHHSWETYESVMLSLDVSLVHAEVISGYFDAPFLHPAQSHSKAALNHFWMPGPQGTSLLQGQEHCRTSPLPLADPSELSFPMCRQGGEFYPCRLSAG